MSDRANQIMATAQRVRPTDLGAWVTPPTDRRSPADSMLVAPADLRWMVHIVNSTEAIMRERNSWARELADMRDERDTARTEFETFKANQTDALDWATARIANLEVAIERVLESVKPTGDPAETLAQIRNLKAVYEDD